MTGALINLLAFIVAISVLVAVHEFGHYIVGRACGMKVLRFSIGFRASGMLLKTKATTPPNGSGFK